MTQKPGIRKIAKVRADPYKLKFTQPKVSIQKYPIDQQSIPALREFIFQNNQK